MICYTIGHSTHPETTFLELLRKHKIDCIVDVRSSPYSKYNPQFNKDNIKHLLKSNGVIYVFMGDLLGARHNDPSLFFKNTLMVNFSKARNTEKFKKGIERVIDGINKGHHLALMCAEKDPFDCHRFVLISYALSKNGIDINHILSNGSIISNSDLEHKLLNKYKTNDQQRELFEAPKTKADAIEEAYKKRNTDIGYVNEN